MSGLSTSSWGQLGQLSPPLRDKQLQPQSQSTSQKGKDSAEVNLAIPQPRNISEPILNGHGTSF